MPPMTRPEMEEFLQRPLVVSFTTIRPDGSPQVTPIWYEYDAGKFYCCVGADSVKARNIRTDSRVTLCIATHDEPYKYVIAEGTCDIVEHDVTARFLSIATRYYGKERGEPFVRELMENDNSVTLVVTPTRVLTESAA